MTIQERHWGTWIETPERLLGILVGVEDGLGAQIYFPDSEATGYFHPNDITLRPDLPRAWNPDGTPPAGEWVYIRHNEEGHSFPRISPSARTTGRKWIGEEEEYHHDPC